MTENLPVSRERDRTEMSITECKCWVHFDRKEEKGKVYRNYWVTGKLVRSCFVIKNVILRSFWGVECEGVSWVLFGVRDRTSGYVPWILFQKTYFCKNIFLLTVAVTFMFTECFLSALIVLVCGCFHCDTSLLIWICLKTCWRFAFAPSYVYTGVVRVCLLGILSGISSPRIQIGDP